jgi:hypothetical protein
VVGIATALIVLIWKRIFDSRWQMIYPGCWIDPEGSAHLFPDEVIAELQKVAPEQGWGYTREDYALVVKTFMVVLREQGSNDDPVIVETWI